jgi:hypothetical protein
MLTIRQDQLDALVTARQRAFVSEMVRMLSTSGRAADDEDVAGWVGACLRLALASGLTRRGDVEALVWLLADQGRPDPHGLPPLAQEVLQANAVAPALKLRMLSDVLAIEPDAPQP